jgi:hypothetical protein
MALKLSELFAKVLRLESHLTAEAQKELADFKADVTAQVNTLQADLLAEQGKVTDLNAKLLKAQTDLSAATGQITETKTALTAAANALKLDLKADATPLETVSALQGAVTTTLAKLNVPAGNIPAPKPGDTGKVAGGKKMTLTEFSALTPQQKMAFTKEVNLGAAKLTE